LRFKAFFHLIPVDVQVRVSCECGHRQATISCSENSYARMTTALLATRMADVQAGNTVDLKVGLRLY
jgi:hypothetical protein